MYGLWLFKELKTEYGYCKVELYRKGYTASAIEIGALVGNSLNLALENLDTITAPIGKSVCSFEIYDTEQFEYDDLFTPDATAYKVVISTKVDGGEYNTRWSGYVTPDFFAENLSFRTPISISARDNIGYLNDVDFNLDAATITVRELIQAAFNRIAEDYPMSLSFVTQKQTAEGILAIDATISTALLREKTWYEALETILHDLGLQMRWVDNNTIAVLDISQLGENFGLQRFNFVERSGYREILPAWRELSQKQDYGLRENFFEGRIKEENLTFVKEEKVTIDGYSADFTNLRFFSINNWVGNGLTINYSDYFFTIGGAMSESERNRIYFTGIDKNSTAYADKYIGWRQRVHKSTNAMKVTFKALNSIQVASSNVYTGVPFLQTFGPYSPGTAQFGLKANILLHSGAKTYVMRYSWEEMTSENEAMSFVLPELSGGAIEEECTIDISNIPYDGELELRIYGWYFISATNWTSMPLNAVSYITDVVYSYDGSVTGQNAKVTVAELHNIKEDRDYSFGQVPLDCGGINAYAGGLFKANGDELVGFKRNVDGSTYPLLELVGREIIHFNKKNYNKLSGTIKNLAKEPLRFDRMFIYKGKNYLPFAYSLDVISNTMNITTMQEVEPYTTHSFVEIKSELVTGGGATISGGNNTALQYSAEVGNAKRISELNNASESEKKESYIVIDNANWNESKKVPLSEMEGLDAEQVEEYLTENKYAKQSWVKGITDDLETDIANRVLIEDFEKLQEAVDLNYTNLNKATTRISTLEGYFSNGVANNAAKLGGQLPSYYATKSALDTTNTNLSNLSTTVGTIAGNLSSLTGRVSTAEDTIKGHTSSINKAVADIAANAKNISTNATNITTVANRVKTLEDLGFILKDGYIYTEKTIVSKGEIISGRRASGASSDVTGGGGISQVTAQMIVDALGYVPYSSQNPSGYITSSALNGYAKTSDIPSLSGYATETWVKQQGYLTQHQDLSAYAKKTDIPSLNGYATEQYVTSRGYITGISSKMVTDALGYTPYNSANFTKANIKSTLGIADWALAASKPSYSWSEVTGKPSFATVATSGKYSDLSGVPTSLPASDVYAWAKKSSLALADVPDLSSKYAAVGLAGTSRYLAIPNGGYIFTRGGVDWNITNGDWSASYKILHEGNYADTADKRYLSLSGGDIYSDSYAPLRMKTTNTQNRLEFVINNTTKAIVGYHPTHGAWLYNTSSAYIGIKDDGTPHYSGNTLYHAGNFNPANYLPLSGGTISGSSSTILTINRTGGTPYVCFNKDGSLLGFLGIRTEGYPVFVDSGGVSFQMLHSGNYSSYALPLSGGRLTDTLRLQRDTEQNYIVFEGPNNTARGYLGFAGDNNPIYIPKEANVIYPLIHSGNIGSQSVDRAIALRGIYPSVTSTNDFYNTEQLIKYHAGFSPDFGNVPSSNSWQNGLLEIGLHSGGASAQFFFSAYKRLYYRSHQTDAWHGVAYLTDNVASATKLQTARTIWGKSFDGTADVWGGIDVNGYKDTNSITKVADLGTTGLVINAASIRTNWGMCFWTEGNGRGMIQQQAFTSAATTYPICLQPFGGNVLIGTTTDRGYKLDVRGGNIATDYGIVGVSSSTYNRWSMTHGSNRLYIQSGLTDGSGTSGDVWISGINTSSLGLLNIIATTMTLSGNFTATGEVISSRRASSSDRRLKNNITYLDTADCLAMVRLIRPAEWDWKDNGKHSMGFIAQDIEHLMPYAVTSIKDIVLGQKLNLQYDQFIALAIGGVQAVDNEVQQLKKEVKKLKKKLAKYEHNGNYRN